MNTPKWFGRKVDLSFGADKYADIYQRLQQAPDTLAHLLLNIPEHLLTHRPEGKWSVIAYFTAEHDDHHIAVIRELIKGRQGF